MSRPWSSINEEQANMRKCLPKRTLIIAAGALAVLGMGSEIAPAHAGSITYVTPPGSSTSGGPVDASAEFVTSAGSLVITLNNLEANPKDVAQNLSDLVFTVSNGSLSGETLSSSSGQVITVDKNGTFTLGSTVSTGWALSTSGTTTGTLDVLGTSTAPKHLIIGPPGSSGTYSNANSSIAGHHAHNPFLNQIATFTISAPNVSDATSISAVTFSFGLFGLSSGYNRDVHLSAERLESPENQVSFAPGAG
jgi:hypothetical protein